MSSTIFLATKTGKRIFETKQYKRYQAVFICNMTNRWFFRVLSVHRPLTKQGGRRTPEMRVNCSNERSTEIERARLPTFDSEAIMGWSL
jgi:hypothetical protein